MNVTITFTSVGADITGPFDLYSNTDPYPGGTPFETNVSLASFATPGYTSTNAPAGTTEVTCVATVGCGQVTVSCDSTTTTTTTIEETTTTTTTEGSTTTSTTTSTPRTLSWSYNTQIGNYSKSKMEKPYNDFFEINVNGVTKVKVYDTGSGSITVHDGDYIDAYSHIYCSGDLTYAYIEYTMLPDAGYDEATCPDQDVSGTAAPTTTTPALATAAVYFTVSNDVNVSACTGIGECGVI